MVAPDTSRKALRRQLVERRMALSIDDHARLSASIRDHLRDRFGQLSSMRVAFCWPFNNEPDLRPLIETWINQGDPGFMALLPVVREPRSPLGFRPWTPDCAMIPDSYGIPTPASGAFVQPQALLIPANGFDAAAYRIGYGGGFFDRTLAELGPDVLRIGIGFELARLDSIHPQAHDIPLNAIVTEAGVFHPE